MPGSIPLFLLYFSLLLTYSISTPVNIHIKLSSEGESIAKSIDTQLHAKLKYDDIFLNTINQPHITLYLTDFGSNISELVQILETLSNNLIPCDIVLSNYSVNETYAFWQVENNKCLQLLSNSVVNATYKLASPNQPIPSWVYSLPEPLRSEKINLIQLYGSPNVFKQFVPHVTIAYDENTTIDNLSAAIESLPSIGYTSFNRIMGLGDVGKHGSILRGKDYADFPLLGDIKQKR